MTVKFYKMTSTSNTINKKKTQIQESDCQLYDETDILNPSLLMKYNKNLLSSNYIYIEEFERFYFINNIDIMDGNRIVVRCHVDVLDSYWNIIKETQQHIIRNSEQFNLYMKDDVMQLTQRTLRQVKTATPAASGFPFLRTPENVGHNFILNSL